MHFFEKLLPTWNKTVGHKNTRGCGWFTCYLIGALSSSSSLAFRLVPSIQSISGIALQRKRSVDDKPLCCHIVPTHRLLPLFYFEGCTQDFPLLAYIYTTDLTPPRSLPDIVFPTIHRAVPAQLGAQQPVCGKMNRQQETYYYDRLLGVYRHFL